MNLLTKLKLTFGVVFISLLALAGLSYADTTIYLPIIKSAYEPKKGVVLPYPNCEDIENLNAGWYYNNLVTPPGNCPIGDKRFVPRIHTPEQTADPNLLTTAINNAKSSGWLMGFPEPNLQAGSTPLVGAQAWRALEQIALPAGLKLVSPAPSPHRPYQYQDDKGNPDPYGYTWLEKMVEAYHGQYNAYPHFDALGWNYYPVDYPPNAQSMKDFLNARRAEWQTKFGGYYQNTPFWLVEYAGMCWNSTNGYPTANTEIMLATSEIKTTPWITRFAWFANRIKPNDPWAPGWQSCSLVNSDTGALTNLGTIYKTY